MVTQPKALNNRSNPHIIHNTKIQVTYHKLNLGIHKNPSLESFNFSIYVTYHIMSFYKLAKKK